MGKHIKIALTALIVSLIFFTGCVSDETPTKKTTTLESEDLSSAKGSSQTTKKTTTTTLPSELHLKAGETAKTSELEVTVVSYERVNYYTYFSSIINQQYVQTAPPGKEFVIVEVDIKNVGKNSKYLSSSSFSLIDGEGYQYDVEPLYMGEDALDLIKDIKPERRTRGKILFEVPESASDLKVEYDFGSLFTGTKLATWELD